ncbi:MAG: nitrile hydratase accessory protein [Gammaproteobacteria bacterium]
MFTRFEEYAATRMLGQKDTPPRSQGKLLFTREWERQLFGLTLAVSKEGHFEWEEFRQNLIRSIGEWEATDCADQPAWDYYERFLIALIRVLEESQLVSAAEIAEQAGER